MFICKNTSPLAQKRAAGRWFRAWAVKDVRKSWPLWGRRGNEAAILGQTEWAPGRCPGRLLRGGETQTEAQGQ